jgi:hypothetical protein
MPQVSAQCNRCSGPIPRSNSGVRYFVLATIAAPPPPCVIAYSSIVNRVGPRERGRTPFCFFTLVSLPLPETLSRKGRVPGMGVECTASLSRLRSSHSAIPSTHIFCDMVCDTTQARTHRITYNATRFYSCNYELKLLKREKLHAT